MIVSSQSNSGSLKSPSNTTDSSLYNIYPIFRSSVPTISSVSYMLYDVGVKTDIEKSGSLSTAWTEQQEQVNRVTKNNQSNLQSTTGNHRRDYNSTVHTLIRHFDKSKNPNTMISHYRLVVGLGGRLKIVSFQFPTFVWQVYSLRMV